MSSRRLRLLAASGFLAGFVCFASGFLVEFLASETVGTSLIGTGAAIMLASRLVARKRGLAAP